MHYDYYNNWYHQVSGRKHFLLLSPHNHRHLQLYPALHPAHRSSQKTLLPLSRGGNACISELAALEVTLAPGELLYIPSLWFHEVKTIDSYALSVNVWSEAAAVILHERAIMEIPLPFTSDLTETETENFYDDKFCGVKTQVIRAYVIMVLSRFKLGSDEKTEAGARDFVNFHLVKGRYASLDKLLVERSDAITPQCVPGVSPSKPDSWPRFCIDLTMLSEYASEEGGWGLRILRSTTETVIEAFEEILEKGGQARFEILLLNWVENVVESAVGPRYAPQFLHDMVNC